MNDELTELEHALAGVPLRKPPASLDGKVLSKHRRLRQAVPWALGGACAAAAVVMTVLLLEPAPDGRRPPLAKAPAEAGPPLDPVRVEETISQVSYEGLFAADEKTPVRMFRRLMLERTWLVDQHSGYTVETTVPREQVLLIGVEVY